MAKDTNAKYSNALQLSRGNRYKFNKFNDLGKAPVGQPFYDILNKGLYISESDTSGAATGNWVRLSGIDSFTYKGLLSEAMGTSPTKLTEIDAWRKLTNNEDTVKETGIKIEVGDAYFVTKTLEESSSDRYVGEGDLLIYMGADQADIIGRYGWFRINGGAIEANTVSFDNSNIPIALRSNYDDLQTALEYLHNSKLEYIGILESDEDIHTWDGDLESTFSKIKTKVNKDGKEYTTDIIALLPGQFLYYTGPDTWVGLEDKSEGWALAHNSFVINQAHTVQIMKVGASNASELFFSWRDDQIRDNTKWGADQSKADTDTTTIDDALQNLMDTKADLLPNNKIPLSQIPNTLIGSVQFKTTLQLSEFINDDNSTKDGLPTTGEELFKYLSKKYNKTHDTDTSLDDDNDAEIDDLDIGDYFIFSGIGTYTFDNFGDSMSVNSGDHIIWNGDQWSLLNASAAVDNVNGGTGSVNIVGNVRVIAKGTTAAVTTLTVDAATDSKWNDIVDGLAEYVENPSEKVVVPGDKLYAWNAPATTLHEWKQNLEKTYAWAFSREATYAWKNTEVTEAAKYAWTSTTERITGYAWTSEDNAATLLTDSETPAADSATQDGKTITAVTDTTITVEDVVYTRDTEKDTKESVVSTVYTSTAEPATDTTTNDGKAISAVADAFASITVEDVVYTRDSENDITEATSTSYAYTSTAEPAANGTTTDGKTISTVADGYASISVEEKTYLRDTSNDVTAADVHVYTLTDTPEASSKTIGGQTIESVSTDFITIDSNVYSRSIIADSTLQPSYGKADYITWTPVKNGFIDEEGIRYTAKGKAASFPYDFYASIEDLKSGTAATDVADALYYDATSLSDARIDEIFGTDEAALLYTKSAAPEASDTVYAKIAANTYSVVSDATIADSTIAYEGNTFSIDGVTEIDESETYYILEETPAAGSTIYDSTGAVLSKSISTIDNTNDTTSFKLKNDEMSVFVRAEGADSAIPDTYTTESIQNTVQPKSGSTLKVAAITDQGISTEQIVDMLSYVPADGATAAHYEAYSDSEKVVSSRKIVVTAQNGTEIVETTVTKADSTGTIKVVAPNAVLEDTIVPAGQLLVAGEKKTAKDSGLKIQSPAVQTIDGRETSYGTTLIDSRGVEIEFPDRSGQIALVKHDTDDEEIKETGLPKIDDIDTSGTASDIKIQNVLKATGDYVYAGDAIVIVEYKVTNDENTYQKTVTVRAPDTPTDGTLTLADNCVKGEGLADLNEDTLQALFSVTKYTKRQGLPADVDTSKSYGSESTNIKKVQDYAGKKNKLSKFDEDGSLVESVVVDDEEESVVSINNQLRYNYSSHILVEDRTDADQENLLRTSYNRLPFGNGVEDDPNTLLNDESTIDGGLWL